jgi:succinoglycan biosynthesis protein ExoA
VRMLADTPFRRALVAALYSKIAVGAVPYRTLKDRAYVESLQTGSFKKAVLVQVGPFDEALAVVEDLDMNTRIRKAGYKLLLDPSIKFWYLPRPSLAALWRQIYAVGLVKARILRKHPDIFKWKYVLPSALVCALAGALVLAMTGATAGLLFLAAYAAVAALFALAHVPSLGAGALRLLAILPTLHVGYGLGFISGAAEKLLGRSSRLPGAP